VRADRLQKVGRRDAEEGKGPSHVGQGLHREAVARAQRQTRRGAGRKTRGGRREAGGWEGGKGAREGRDEAGEEEEEEEEEDTRWRREAWTG
jgi:hypothetical protein